MDNKKEETPLETFQRIDRATEERHRNHLSMMSQHSMLPQPKFDKLEVRDYNLEEMQEQTEIQKEALG